MLNILRFILLLAMVVWIGMLVFFTFVVAPGLFKVLPNELAGDFAVYIFPKYWMVGYVSGVLSLLAILAISFIEKSFPAGRIFILALMTALTFYSGLFVSLSASNVRAEMKKAEDPARKEALKEDFRSLHRRSAAINLGVIVLGVGYIYLTARNMRL